jgi:single-stranded-DNA-specific exonuclease
MLADLLQQQGRLCIVADYDCDGATACAVLLRGLALLGFCAGQLGYVVPDRAVHGYGLTPAIVELALAGRPQLLLTVDNGIASIGAWRMPRRWAWRCWSPTTICARWTPTAARSCRRPTPSSTPTSRAAALRASTWPAWGDAFYVLLALRAELRRRGAFDAAAQPKLDGLLDLVALGTVADVVRLDANNRRLVAQGLRRIRAGQMQPGVRALFQVAGREPARAGSADFGFAIGPRINAAGRLTDMRLGIECLRTDDPALALELAQRLDAINRERRAVEADMRERADALLASSPARRRRRPPLALFDEAFHEGVVGILAGRVKDALHRPTFVFARGADGRLKGSGRSVPGVHLRDALDLLVKREPDLVARFGGHAMAAGCQLARDDVAALRRRASSRSRARTGRRPGTAARAAPRRRAGDAERLQCVATVAELLEAQVWGQGFEAPLFTDEVEIVHQRLVGEKHLKLSVRHAGQLRDAIWFGQSQPLPAKVRLAYRISLDEYQGRQRVQMVVEGVGT